MRAARGQTAAWLLAACALAGCGAQRPVEPPGVARAPAPDAEPEAAAEPVRLRADWDELGLYAFETWVLAAFPEGRATPLAEQSLAVLRDALDGQDLRAVRAAVVLARSGDRAAAEQLAGRLELRARAAERDDNAADCVAAAGLARSTAGRALAERLAELAVGQSPHPDLEVRVECAASALACGRAETVAFLLRVLREGTPAADSAPDWDPTDALAWAKSRAAGALARHAGAPLAFEPDASIEDQMAAAERLERALRESGDLSAQ